jgi:hypothetical protein
LSYDTILPVIDLAQFADDARRLMGYKMFYAGFGIIGLGFVGKQIANLFRIMRNKEADLLTPFLTAAGFIALLASYKVFVTTTIYLVSRMGLTGGWDDDIVTTFVTRAATFARWKQEHGSWKAAAMEYTVGLLYLLIEAWVVFMRAAQTFMLAVVVTYGPLLLGLAALGGIFLPLGIGWFWALVEISAWSVTMDILLLGYAKMKHVPTVEEISLGDEFIFAFVMFGLLIGIPGITSFLIRGSSGAVVSSGISTATRTATMIATSKLGMKINTAAYNAVKSGVQKSFKWTGNQVRGGGAESQWATPASAWSAAEAMGSHRESRATAARSQAVGHSTSSPRGADAKR